MKKRRAFAIAALLAIVILALSIKAEKPAKSELDYSKNVYKKDKYYEGVFMEGASDQTSFESLKCLYYNEKAFFNSLSVDNAAVVNGREQEGDQARKIEDFDGGILPHHLVAAPMIGRFFKEIKAKCISPSTVIIMAPNHKRIGDAFIHTGALNWDTPFGMLKPDNKFIDMLVDKMGARVIPELLEEEHSIAALVPYIKHTFPNSEFVPILIHGNMKMKDCIRLSDLLSRFAERNNSLILASIDFSHGLLPVEALKNDELTMKIIEQRDYIALLGLGNEYLDAPPTLAAFLMTMDKLGAKNELLFEHSEASKFMGKPLFDTTSYMSYGFYN